MGPVGAVTKFSDTGAIIRENVSVTLGSLADNTVIKFSTNTLVEDFRMMKAEIHAHIAGLTAGEGDGLLLGIANNELSVAEIKECLEANGPLNTNDRALQEFAGRAVRIIGAAAGGQADTHVQFVNTQGGPLLVHKWPWTFANPEGWCWFVYNHTGSALTTGAVAALLDTIYGMWVT